MLNLFKKKDKPVETPTPINQAGVPLETGKEIQFKDPKTGEFVYQRAISSEHRKEIFTAMQKNANAAQAFMQVSRNILNLQERLIQENKNILDSEKEINDIINKVRDELKLDRRWGLNMQLGVLEKREPPNG